MNPHFIQWLEQQTYQNSLMVFTHSYEDMMIMSKGRWFCDGGWRIKNE